MSPEDWSKVKPRSVVSGSQAQAENVMTMALQDIASQGSRIKLLEEHMSGLIRILQAVQMSAGLGKNQIARIKAAESVLGEKAKHHA